MLEFLIDNIFVIFDGRVFNRQSAFLMVLSTCTFVLRLCAGASQEKRKEAHLILQFHGQLKR